MQQEEDYRPSQSDANSKFSGNVELRVYASNENATVEEQDAELDEAIRYNGKEEECESKLVAG